MTSTLIPPLLAAATELAPMHPVGVAMCVAAGVLGVLGGWRNWDWFFDWPPAPMFVALLTRPGARIFYVLLGLGLIAGGVLGGMAVI